MRVWGYYITTTTLQKLRNKCPGAVLYYVNPHIGALQCWNMIRVAILLSFFSLIPQLHAQNTIGLPEVVNYSKQTYHAGTQNWAIRQGRNGVMYFANNEGLLTFDGVYWRTYPLPNKTKVRSMEIGADNRIYIGGENEFGYFTPDQQGAQWKRVFQGQQPHFCVSG